MRIDKTLVTLVLASVGLWAGQALAAGECEKKAVDKNGKPLAGAAKDSFIKKCEKDAGGGSGAAAACEKKAVDKNGKPLAGAAKDSSIKKCMADSAAKKG